MKNNIKKIIYIIKHKIAFIQTAKKCRGYITFSDIIHDMDKIVLLTIGMNPKKVSKFHRSHSKHHMQNDTIKDINSAIIDFECARITKPDKPMNARQTIAKYYPQISSQGIKICDKWNI